ncbi:GNAT family N-acetyltransferase [Psychrobacter sp. Sarcosine-02u-2]|jgi:ribosomal protein S18 acetylase RimI-like enzyme|uniref:GNAT family N-acetyltransferase n=1 Tax=Psychrobacter TaxID=497 RepID=UPI000C7CCA54|nr:MULTISPECIES: GNAT family N-acetyltransferase [Psychrobacter]PKG86117.1 GNAT family N-acetyltransferase [Psychrobacter sp. Sarcosine-02u-2]
MNKDHINKEALNKTTVFLRQAEVSDIDALEQLLNRCYRQAAGWTNEADLVGGIRTTKDELLAVINDPKHYVFIYPKTTTGERDVKETGELLGCIAVDIKDEVTTNQRAGNQKAYIGMFAVLPELQGHGVGHQILQAAETFAQRHLQSNIQASAQNPARLTMSILSHRPELLAYYQRRGYQLNGNSMPFPVDGNNGEPKRQDLELLELEKLVS